MQRTDRVERVRMTVLEEEGTPETFTDLLQLLQDPNGIKAFAVSHLTMPLTLTCYTDFSGR